MFLSGIEYLRIVPPATFSVSERSQLCVGSASLTNIFEKQASKCLRAYDIKTDSSENIRLHLVAAEISLLWGLKF